MRTVPAGLIAALSGPNARPFFAFEGLFDSSPFRMWTGYGDRTINGVTFRGSGDTIGFGPIEEVVRLEAKSASITLSAVPSSTLQTILAEPWQGRPGRIFLGDLSVSAVMVAYSGEVDLLDPIIGPTTSIVNVTLESVLRKKDRPEGRRLTKESQRKRYPNDSFFDRTADLADRPTDWRDRR